MATLTTSALALASRLALAWSDRPCVEMPPAPMALALPPEVAEASMAERVKPPTAPPSALPWLLAASFAVRPVSPVTVKLADEPNEASTSPVELALASPRAPPGAPRAGPGGPPSRWGSGRPGPGAVRSPEPAPTVLLTLALVRLPVVACDDRPATASPPAAPPSDSAFAVLSDLAWTVK